MRNDDYLRYKKIIDAISEAIAHAAPAVDEPQGILNLVNAAEGLARLEWLVRTMHTRIRQEKNRSNKPWGD
jgi:hypothetical protein